MKLSNLKPEITATIVSIGGNMKLVKRLRALGCIEGTEVKFKRCAPLGDPIIVRLRGFNFAIRKNDAGYIIVV